MSIKKIIFTLLLLAVPVLFAIVTNAEVGSPTEGASQSNGSEIREKPFQCDACERLVIHNYEYQLIVKRKNEYCHLMPKDVPCTAPTISPSTPAALPPSGAGQTK